MKAAELVADFVARKLGEFYGKPRAVEIKSVAGYLRAYAVDLSTLVTDCLNGDIGTGELSSGMRALIREYAEDTYIEGYKDAGNKDPELDEIDHRNIDDWKAEQIAAIAGFVAAVRAVLKQDDPTQGQAGIISRLDLWESALQTLAGMATARELADIFVTWHVGDAEHCKTCARLDGKRKRLSWFTDNGFIPQENDSETLDCHGWRCQCVLKDDKGKVILPA